MTTTPSISKSSSPRRRLPGETLGDDVVLGAQQLHVAVDAEPVRAQPLQCLPVGVKGEPLGDPHLVAPDRQGPFGGERGVELAHGAGRGVAGVHERREALLGAALVECGEVVQRHVQLAPDLQQRRRVLDVQRDRADGAQVVGDVLAHLPVPAGGAALEHPVAVDKRDRQAVDLRLDHVGEARLSRPFAREVVAHPLDPRAQLVLRARVGERQHGLQVRDLLQPADRGAPHALRGRVGVRSSGCASSSAAQLVEQRVVGVVPDDRVVEHVVAVRVVLDLAPQDGRTRGGVVGCGGGIVRAGGHRTGRGRAGLPCPAVSLWTPALRHLSRPPPRRRRAGRAGRSCSAPPCRGRSVRSKCIGVTAMRPAATAARSVPGSSWKPGSSP